MADYKPLSVEAVKDNAWVQRLHHLCLPPCALNKVQTCEAILGSGIKVAPMSGAMRLFQHLAYAAQPNQHTAAEDAYTSLFP